jgi:hypothetical protein
MRKIINICNSLLSDVLKYPLAMRDMEMRLVKPQLDSLLEWLAKCEDGLPSAIYKQQIGTKTWKPLKNW